MSGSRCKHSNVEIAEALLERDGHISAYSAVYEVDCPMDGVRHRNTRLAATIWTLRHTRGWDIQTVKKKGVLADYIVMGRETPTTPLPAKEPATSAPPAPQPTVARTGYKCSVCMGKHMGTPEATMLGGMARGYCPLCNILGVWTPA